MKERKQKDSALKQNPVKAPKPAKAQKVPKEKKEKKSGLHSMRFNERGCRENGIGEYHSTCNCGLDS